MISAKYIQTVSYTISGRSESLNKKFTYNPNKDQSSLIKALNKLRTLTTAGTKEFIANATYKFPTTNPTTSYIITTTALTYAELNTWTTGNIRIINQSIVTNPETKYEIIDVNMFLKTTSNNYLIFEQTGNYNPELGTIPFQLKVTNNSGYKNYTFQITVNSVRGIFEANKVLKIAQPPT